ncbi:PilN domain-containing protein [Arenibaculum sp.]|jgi:general secretion pathway protein L|uniref:PilN domain-containing protein n=1 Tax=Arenibaculum sp. TaxID=2865862 RepID=UPI002E0F4EEF|nr:PilN domain-containing protein [Arenibaculum sp.]
MTGISRALAVATDLGHRFLTWWLDELTALIPGFLKFRQSGNGSTLFVDLERGEVVIRSPGDGGVPTELGRFPLDAVPEAAKGLNDALKRLTSSSRAVAMRLPRREVLRRTINLPFAARKNLRDVLAFEVERIMPFAADDLYFDFRVLECDATSRTLRVDIAAAERRRIDAARGLAESWGLEVARIGLNTETVEEPILFDLLNGARPAGRPRGPSRTTVLLSLLATVLAGASLYLPLSDKRAAADALSGRVEESRARADAAEALRSRVEHIVAAGSFVVDRKLATPSATEILHEVTRILPDEVWLSQLGIEGGEIRMSGYSPAASGLLEPIEHSDLFGSARFRSPVTRDAQSGLERFEIVAEIVERSSPP